MVEPTELTAKIWHGILSEGRSKPSKVTAEDFEGKAYDVVVKPFKANKERGKTASVSELVSNLLASRLGLSVPEPFLVRVPAGFDQIVGMEDIKRHYEGVSERLFGCQLIPDVTTVPTQRKILPTKRSEALGVILFDALVQNHDRKIGRPNILEHSGGFFLIDHDLAFDFLGGIPIIGGAQKPWIAPPTLKDHVFYPGLRGKELDGSGFETRLKSLTEIEIQAILGVVPDEWWQAKNSEG